MKLTEIEQAKKNAIKIARAAIRLKHSIKADEELNDRLHDILKAFDRQVMKGTLPDAPSIITWVS
jgi:hypothetical protein